MIFPVEIWEHIFLYVDPPTLVNMRIICKCWKDIIDKMLQQSAQWYKLCKNEIPEEFWSTLCETLDSKRFYTNFHEKHDVKFWIAMYKLWIKCKNMTKCDTQSKCIKPIDNPTEYITCIDTSENLLAIGTSEGLIYLYHLPNLQTCEYIVDHMEYIHSVKLLRDETNIVCICCSINNHISFWDVKTLKLLSMTHGKFISTSYSYCYIAMHNKISIEGSIPRRLYEFSADNVVAIGANYNKLLFYTERGYFVNMSLDEDTKEYIYRRALPLNIRIRHYYVFKPNIIACITEFGYVGFLVQEQWKIHNLFPILYGTPTVILVYGHILFLGLDSGNVHIFYIDDFRTINFDIIASKKLCLDSSAVISLNIMVYNEEYLIVGYSQKIYFVEFI